MVSRCVEIHFRACFLKGDYSTNEELIDEETTKTNDETSDDKPEEMSQKSNIMKRRRHSPLPLMGCGC